MAAEQQQRPYVPSKALDTPYPLIDNDPHIKRVIRYARPSDYAAGTAIGLFGPGMMLLWNQISPSHVGKGGFASIMRLSGAIGVVAAFIYTTERSTSEFMGQGTITWMQKFSYSN
ncbi:hypothetical protein MMC30_009016 [Trapelia coarctata]|nr:hypothetical protein [Trapelia coarctata]